MSSLPVNSNATKDFSVLPNILDKYSQYSYYFRLYLADPTDRTQQVTLAETASSVVSIQEVRISSVTGMNRESGIGISTKFEMVLKQPFGATFVDSIIDAANRLGIQQPLTVPYWLELTFRARDPNSQAVITDETIGQLKWAWPLIFRNTEINAQAQGSTYNISAWYMHDTAFENTNEQITTSISIPAATVGEFFEGFAQTLNDHEQQRLGIIFPNTYKFLIEDPEISNARLIPDSIDKLTDRHIQLEGPTGKTLVVFSPNTTIRYIISTVLMSTHYFQTRATQLLDPNSSNDDIKTTDLFRQLFRVVPEIEFDQFDPRTNNYSKKLIYGIFAYDFTTAFVNIQDIRRRQIIDNTQQVNAYIETGKLRKVYNYLFTGLNDQVIDFDLKFTFNWYLAGIWQMGQTIDSANADFAPIIDNLENIEKDIGQLTTRLTDLRSQAQPQQDQIRDVEIRLQARRAQLINLRRETTSQLVQQRNQSRQRIQPGEQIFAEILTQARLEREVAEGVILTPPVIYTKPGEFNRSLGGTSGPGRTKISIMMDQMFSPTMRDLQNVQIKIKGDPYWLEPDPINGANTPSGIESFLGRPPRTSQSINNDSTRTQTYFLFRAFLPQPPDPNTGLQPPRSANTVINGLYWAKNIEHEFVGGQFTQTITGIRDVTVNVNDIEYVDGVPVVRRQVDSVEQRENRVEQREKESQREPLTEIDISRLPGLRGGVEEPMTFGQRVRRFSVLLGRASGIGAFRGGRL